MEKISKLDMLRIYRDYFLHNDYDNWRRGVFHYGIIIHEYGSVAAQAFIGEGSLINSNLRGINSFLITTKAINNVVIRDNKSPDFVYACYILHESGHTLGIDVLNPMGCDNIFANIPVFPAYWLYESYKSVMNYRYATSILDYSDGSHGMNDNDDWSQLDLTWFEIPEGKRVLQTRFFQNILNIIKI